MDIPSTFTWYQFRHVMGWLAKDYEKRAKPLLDLFREFDDLVGLFTLRELGYGSERPHDGVACTLAVRAFRLTTGAIHLALSGYSDATPNLTRTVWEIGIRLLDMRRDP